MKMGTILSPWPYDAAACHALQPANLRRPAILRYASGAAFFPDSAGWSGYPSIAAMPSNPRIDVMGQQRNSSHMADRDHYATNKPSRVVPSFHLAAAWSTTSATIHTNAASWTEKKVERTAMAALEPEARCALVCTTRAATTPADNTSSVAE